MPQQINLCTPLLLTHKRYLSAQTMLQALVAVVVVGAALLAHGVRTMDSSAQVVNDTMAGRKSEMANLRAVVAGSQTDRDANLGALRQELAAARERLLLRQGLLAELQSGLLVPGQGHSARLQLVAQSIPTPVWVTGVEMESSRLQVQGFTIEPEALNTWVATLAHSPLLAGQALARIKVEAVAGADAAQPREQAVASGSRLMPGAAALWSYSLTSVAPESAPASAGAKP